MDTKEKIEIVNSDGSKESVDLVTYLISEDKLRQYIVYTKGEVRDGNDRIIYISRLFKVGNEYKLEEISEDAEWMDVQRLLKKLANLG